METVTYQVIEVKSPQGTTYLEAIRGTNMFEFYARLPLAERFYEEEVDYDDRDWKSYITKDDCETTYYRMIELEKSEDYSFTVKDITATFEVN